VAVTTQVQSSGFKVQWLFAEPLTVKPTLCSWMKEGIDKSETQWL
jgi:hypothetical protein